MTFPYHDLPGAGIIVLAVGTIIIVAELWSRLGKPPPEWPRKFVHAGGGIVCVFFPFLVDSTLVVLVVAVIFSAGFVIGRKTGFLKFLHGVSRRTQGDEYYPLAIFLIFMLAHRQPWLYVSSVLVLAVSDTLAAIIGSQYGSIRYEVDREHKSLEGSLVFMVATFIVVHLPMLLMTDIPRANCVLSATLVAVLVTCFEAISYGGADNLFVPLGVYVILSKISTKPLPEIVYQNLSLLGIAMTVTLVSIRTRVFNVGSTMTYMLFAYGAWSLGSEFWALPAITGFFVYIGFRVLKPLTYQIKAGTVARAFLPPLVVLVYSNAFASNAFCYGPYLAACTMVLAFSLCNHSRRTWPCNGWRRKARVAGLGLLSWAAISWLPRLLQHNVAPISVATIATIGVVAVPFVLLGDTLVGPAGVAEEEKQWSASSFLLTAAAAGVIAFLQAMDLIPLWNAV